MSKKIKEIDIQPSAQYLDSDGLRDETDSDAYDDEDEDIYEDEDVDECISNISGDNEREKRAVRRIEQANLYLILLNHPLFAPGSARPEIITTVENELKDFILERLEVLLGMRRAPAAVPLPESTSFSKDQVEALSAIANRLIKKQPVSKTPTPQIMPVQASPTVMSRQSEPLTTQATPGRKKKNKNKPKTIVIRPPTEEEGNRGSDGTDYSQKVSTKVKPRPMPNQAELNMINSASVDAAQGARSSGQAGELGALLNAAIILSQQKNANVKEDDQ